MLLHTYECYWIYNHRPRGQGDLVACYSKLRSCV